MELKDRVIKCKECGENFEFSVKDQKFYQTRGFSNEPKRCPTCRSSRRQQTQKKDNRPARKMYEATCFSCGETAQVPFVPTTGKPIYCNNCFAQKKDSSTNTMR